MIDVNLVARTSTETAIRKLIAKLAAKYRDLTFCIASWRPIHQNRSAVKVIGSPFATFPEAEKACEAVLGHLKERARGYSRASPLRAGLR
jgi:hypothetical protein